MNDVLMNEDPLRRQKPIAPAAPGGGEGGGPAAPKVDKPNIDDLLKRMKKVDPEQAKRYRQRTGE